MEQSLIGTEYKVLDHGFIRVVDYMGDDLAIVQAARVSYGSGTKSVREDRGLIRYLMKHRHTSPLEMCELKLHVKMPIFVARQWVRHRTASLNEYSARYSILGSDYYIPEHEHMCAQSTNNKQGRGGVLSEDNAIDAEEMIRDVSVFAYSNYQLLLNDKNSSIYDPNFAGVSREIARTVLPVNYYTEMYWKMDLHNLLHFLELRLDKHAQWEIRQYAEVIYQIVKLWVPITAEAFDDYILNAVTLSKQEIEFVRDVYYDKTKNGNYKHAEDLGLSKREADELIEKLYLYGVGKE